MSPAQQAPAQLKPAAENKPAEAAKGPAKAAIGAPSAASDGAKVPDGTKLNLMIRTAVIAVNQANKTGNYSVLRDLATPSFQIANNPAQLAEIFADLRKRNLDLSPVLFYQPKFASRPAQLANGMLRVTGHFPSRPQQVHFDLVFEQIQGDWRLFRVGIGAYAAPPPDKPGEAAVVNPSTLSAAAGGPLPAAPEPEAGPKAEAAAPNVLSADKPEITIAPPAEPAVKEPAEKKIPGKLAEPPAAKPAEASAEAKGTPLPQPKPKP